MTMSGQCGNAVGAPDVPGRVGAERRQRVLALDAVLVEVDGAGAADRRPRRALGADEQEPDPGMVAQGGDDIGVARLEGLERDAPRLARERHEPEAAGRHHDDLGRLLALRRAGSSPRSRRTAPSTRRRFVAPRTARAATESLPAASVSEAPR